MGENHYNTSKPTCSGSCKRRYIILLKVLIVEHDKKLADLIRTAFKEEGYSCDTAENGALGIFLARTNSYDLMLLGSNLPKLANTTICHALRQERNLIPIIVMAERNETLPIKADQCEILQKPFALEELFSKIYRLLYGADYIKKNILRIADLEIDQINNRVSRGGKEITLTQKEYKLLEYLMQNAGTIISRKMIIERVWEYSFDPFTNIVDVYINHLREKIDRRSPKKLIQTVRERGYIIRE